MGFVFRKVSHREASKNGLFLRAFPNDKNPFDGGQSLTSNFGEKARFLGSKKSLKNPECLTE